MNTKAYTVKNTKQCSNPDNTNIEVTSFVFKGSLFALTSVQLQSIDLDSLNNHIQFKIQQAPKFFNNIPVVIDLSKFPKEYTPDLNKIIKILKNNKLIPIGIKKSRNQEINKQAINSNIAILAENKSINKKQNINSDTNNINSEQAISNPVCKIINTPVRSGQQVYARGCDLIIMAPVSNGAEILADGNIHVYGPLRGRALAGVMNNKSANIFCQSLEAELVSIAGTYQVSENLRDNHWMQSVHIQLNNSNLHIEKM